MHPISQKEALEIFSQIYLEEKAITKENYALVFSARCALRVFGYQMQSELLQAEINKYQSTIN